MSSEDTSNKDQALASIQDEGLRMFLMELDQRVGENQLATRNQLQEIFSMLGEINDRLRATERYISKDCLVIKNPPFDPRDQQKLLDNLLDFFKKFLNINFMSEDRLKAYHILPRASMPANLKEPVIVKFVYFYDKDAIYAASKKKSFKNNSKTPLNGKNIYVNERLPSFEMDLKRAIDKLGYVTVTKNCAINVVCLDNDGNTKYVAINNLEDLKNLHNPFFRDPKSDHSITKARASTTFKRAFSALKDDEKAEAMFNSLSPDQKKAFLEKANAQTSSMY